MNLVIDIGNTFIKAALFKNNRIMVYKRYSEPSELLQDKELINNASKAIIGTVVTDFKYLYNSLNTILPTVIFTSQTPTPLLNNYKSISTLGSDRLLASLGSYQLYPNANVLTIDSGTCVKYNFTNSENAYLGGGISLGIRMRFKALNQFTSKLPLIEFDEDYKNLIGSTTQESILSGVLNGTVAEIDGIITYYQQQYPNLICVLTGGDSSYLANRLKNPIFTEQHLLLKGLNYALNTAY